MSANPERPVAPHRLWRAAVAGGGGALGVLIALWIVVSPSAPFHRSAPLPPSVPVSTPPVGHPAPDFALPTFSGGTLDLRTLRGHPVLLNFWASWCGPCLAETPLLLRLHKVYGPRGVVFLGINVEDETAEARRFIGKHHVDYTVVRAPDQQVLRAYAIIGLPTTVLIGADGIVVGKEVGGFIGPDGESDLTSQLDRLLKSTAH